LKKVLYLIIASLLVMGLVLAGCPSGNGNGVEPTKVDIAAITGVTKPEAGATRVTSITATTQFTGTVTWAPAHTTFLEGTEYTATITLSAKTGFTFSGVSANFFTVAGATEVTNPAGSGVVTAKFPATAAPTPKITFAVTGPMTFIQGLDHWAGAEMARDEINAGAGVNVGGVRHDIDLIKVETNEILDVSGVAGKTALTAAIDRADFVVGGFRTEAVAVYREVAMDAKKIMMNCGAATSALQMSVVTNYDKYKYWFKATPYNEVFLVTSTMKYTGLVHTQMRLALGLPPAYTGEGDDYKLRFAIMMESAEWSNPMEAPVIAILTGLGLQHEGTFKCESAASDLESQLTAISAKDPHIIFTILSGPPGRAYGAQQSVFVPTAMSMGINVEAQDITYHAGTGAEYHITLDTWAPLLEVTPTALTWFNAIVAKTGRWPAYTAATYDAIYSIKSGVEAVSAANGWTDIATVTSAANIDELIEYIATTPRLGVGANTAYYPVPALGPFDPIPGTPLSRTFWALSAEQALALYPNLPGFYGLTEEQLKAAWLPNQIFTQFTTIGGHIAHDTVYGPGYQTGIAVQWQEIDGAWKKVGIWPTHIPIPGFDALLTDRYGNWNFAYIGTQPLKIDPAWITHHKP